MVTASTGRIAGIIRRIWTPQTKRRPQVKIQMRKDVRGSVDADVAHVLPENVLARSLSRVLRPCSDSDQRCIAIRTNILDAKGLVLRSHQSR